MTAARAERKVWEELSKQTQAASRTFAKYETVEACNGVLEPHSNLEGLPGSEVDIMAQKFLANSAFFLALSKEESNLENKETLELPHAVLEALLRLSRAPGTEDGMPNTAFYLGKSALEGILNHCTNIKSSGREIRCSLDERGIPKGQAELFSVCRRLQDGAQEQGATQLHRFGNQTAAFAGYAIIIMFNTPTEGVQSGFSFSNLRAVVQAIQGITAGFEVALANDFTQEQLESLDKYAIYLVEGMVPADDVLREVLIAVSSEEACSMLQPLLSTLEGLYTVHTAYVQRSTTATDVIFEMFEYFCVRALRKIASTVSNWALLQPALNREERNVLRASSLLVLTYFKKARSGKTFRSLEVGSLACPKPLAKVVTFWAEAVMSFVPLLVAALEARQQDEKSTSETAAAVLTMLHALEAVAPHRQLLDIADMTVFAVSLYNAANPALGLGSEVFRGHPATAKLFAEHHDNILECLREFKFQLGVEQEWIAKFESLCALMANPADENVLRKRAVVLSTLPCGYLGCTTVRQPGEKKVQSKLCAGCKTIRYCSEKCQKKDWKQHKVVCKLLAAEQAEQQGGGSGSPEL